MLWLGSIWGDAQLQLGQLQKAQKTFERALPLMPDEASLLARLGRVCQLLGQLENSAKWLKKALKFSPDDATLWRSQGSHIAGLGTLASSPGRF
jgi:tetratricopeptide (TPR) repeat protein